MVVRERKWFLKKIEKINSFNLFWKIIYYFFKKNNWKKLKKKKKNRKQVEREIKRI